MLEAEAAQRREKQQQKQARVPKAISSTKPEERSVFLIFTVSISP